MIYFIGVFVIAGVIIIAVKADKFEKKGQDAVLSELAFRYGLAFRSKKNRPETEIYGKYRKMKISVSAVSSDDSVTVKIGVKFRKGGLKKLWIMKNTIYLDIDPEIEFIPVECGDAVIDRYFQTSAAGMNDSVAFLNQSMRDSLVFFRDNARQFFIKSDGIKIIFGTQTDAIFDEFDSFMIAVCRIAGEIRLRKTAYKRLLQNIKNEKDDAVKISNLYSLVKLHPGARGLDRLMADEYELHDPEIKRKLFCVIRWLKLSRFEKYLLNELKHGENEIIEDILDAIASAGTVKSVEPVMRFSKQTFNISLRKKCAETVAAVQSRLGKAEKGWISVDAENEMAGALSGGSLPGKGSLSRKKKRK